MNDPEFDAIDTNPNKRAASAGYPLGTVQDVVVGTVTAIDTEDSKYPKPDGTIPKVPIVTLANAKWNGQPYDGDLVLKGFHAGMARILRSAQVNDRIGLKYLGQSAGGAHIYEGGSVPPAPSDMPATEPQAPEQAGQAAVADSDIPFRAAI